jgi:uncharacterized protein with HEPN domain
VTEYLRKQKLSMKDDKVYLKHILEAIGTIEEYLADIEDEASLKQNRMAFDAVVRNLGIIGEAANNLSNEFKQKHPELPYSDIIGMRNVIIHDYLGTNVKIIWDTCKEDLPILKEQLSTF